MLEPNKDLMAQLEQEHMLAQVISGIPNNIEGQPDITTPAPIRARWAHRLYQQGIRIHPELATHKIVSHDSGLAGPHGPREFQKINKDKLLQQIQESNPGLYKRIMDAKKERQGGEGMAEQILQQVLNRLPQEWLDKLSETQAKTDEFADANIPDEPVQPTVIQQPDPEPET